MALGTLILFFTLFSCREVSGKSPFEGKGRSFAGKKSKMVSEGELADIRERHVKLADSLAAKEDYRGACIAYQKALDELMKRGMDHGFDEWMRIYGSLYKQVDGKLRKSRSLFEAGRKHFLADLYSRHQKERLSQAASLSGTVRSTPLKKAGSLSLDGTLVLAVAPSDSPFADSRQVVGLFAAESGEKLYEESPVPDDRHNPQITRWGRSYLMRNPVWSPDGTRYAYTLNGALCVNDDGSGKPVLVSAIPDSRTENDVAFWWSPDGKKLAYVRDDGKSRTVYWNMAAGASEQKVSAGSRACFSSDSSMIAVIAASRVHLFSLATGRSEALGSGDECAFSPDDSLVAVVKRQGGTWSLDACDLKKRRETGLASSRDFRAFTGSTPRDITFLSRNLLAFTLSGSRGGRRVSEIWACSLPQGGISMVREGELRQWLATPMRLATEQELLFFSR
ncbi:MAG: hypothetical protein RDV48_02675 [Candidatus Eremiobacteraeota bacterium]|nr:hypothetical protein [Candidatus Eremiobacteraeota bacterium]